MRLLLVCLAAIVAMPAMARIERSAAEVLAFKRHNPCPATGQRRGACPGYVIDHIEALACGGADATGNMQWQTQADAKAKDKWERKGCVATKVSAIR